MNSIWKWHAVLLIATCLFSYPRSADAQECVAPEPVATSAEFVEWLECTLVVLEAVWMEDIRAAIQIAHANTGNIETLDLVYISDCDFSPRLDDIDGDGQPEVIVNTRLLIPQMALSQAILWYIVAPEGKATPQAHLDYLENTLLPAVRQDVRACSRHGAVGRFSAVPIHSFFSIYPDQHQAFLNSDTPTVRTIGDYVGALPAFFATIHEAGHAVLHGNDTSSLALQREMEADLFAAEVFASNDVPLTLGLGFFLIAYSLDRAGPNSDVACRLVELVGMAETLDSGTAPELGRLASNRLTALRAEYLARYALRCET